MANGKHFHTKEFDECEQLPESYGVTNITLIVRDPHWLYAYWEISSDTLAQTQRALGKTFTSSSLTLRMHDVTLVNFNGRNANGSFDIKVPADTNDHYVNLWADNVSYCAEIGLLTSDGKFHALSRSNTASTQRRDWANKFDINYGEVRYDKAGRPYLLTDTSTKTFDKKLKDHSVFNADTGLERGQPTKPSETDLEGHHSWQDLPSKLVEQTHRSRKRRQPLSGDEILAYYARLFPRLRKTKPKLIERLKRKGLWKHDDLDPESTPDTSSLFQGLSPYAKELFFKRARHGASAEFEEQGSQNETGGASESLLNVGGASELPYRARKFFFDLYAELIVYGRTEPDATVWWGKEKIALRPDGTFSLRFALPDKHFPLDFIAESHDKIEQRSIITAVERFKTICRTDILPQ